MSQIAINISCSCVRSISNNVLPVPRNPNLDLRRHKEIDFGRNSILMLPRSLKKKNCSLIKIHLSYGIEVHIMYRIHTKLRQIIDYWYFHSFRICLMKIASFKTYYIDTTGNIVIWSSYDTIYRFFTLMIKLFCH